MADELDDLIYDWNASAEAPKRPARKVEFDDETLRDGLQSPSVTDPSIDQKLRIVHFMHELGIDNADIGLPGAGPHVQATVERLAREIVSNKLSVYPSAAGRTVASDVKPIIDISQKVGIAIEADLFIGSSPIRQFAEEWDLDWIIQQSVQAVKLASSNGLPVMYVTEDTTRARPEAIEKLYTAAIEAGATRLCIADTVGHATPWGARAIVRFVRGIVERTNPAVKVDWHGHSDRGLGVINSIAALEAGADRVHGSAAGIGERVGNTPIDILMVNLKLMGWIDNDVTRLGEYVGFVSDAVRIPLSQQYPVFGHDAFRTGTGVHAAAIIKAKKKGNEWLADRVYSSVPAGMFGLRQIIEIGPMCGLSNVVYWLAAHNYPQEESLARQMFQLAKSMSRVLTDDELHSCVRRWQEKARGAEGTNGGA